IDYYDPINANHGQPDPNGADLRPWGYFRRSRHAWYNHPTNQDVESGVGWGASYDELVGMVVGLHYFLEQTRQDSAQDPDGYHDRAKAMLQRVSNYLIRNRHWIFSDSRVHSDP